MGPLQKLEVAMKMLCRNKCTYLH